MDKKFTHMNCFNFNLDLTYSMAIQKFNIFNYGKGKKTSTIWTRKTTVATFLSRDKLNI